VLTETSPLAGEDPVRHGVLGVAFAGRPLLSALALSFSFHAVDVRANKQL
jgi:hypothetical protein